MKFNELDKGQKKRLLLSFFTYFIFGAAFLIYSCAQLYSDRMHAADTWPSYLQDSPEQAAKTEALSKNAVNVTVGTYVENLREINIKGSSFRAELAVWFRWEGPAEIDPANHFRIYKGLINKYTIVKEIHENGTNYQLVNIDVTISKNYSTKRFPLDLHQMRVYVECTYPIEEVIFTPDHENSGINRNITITGYEFLKHDIGGVSYVYDGNHGDPEIKDNVTTSEIVTAFEINRSGFGLYFKCFIALMATIIWALIALYICTYHHVDPLGMIPGALFGAVGNIMIGANLLPDALETGLLEYVNLMGIITILAVSVSIININRIRNKYQNKAFAHYYGRVMFYIVLSFTVLGNILLPVLAYHNG